MTRQAGGSGDGISVPPFMTAVNHDDDRRAQLVHRGPLPTRSTKIGDGLVFPPYMVDFHGTGTANGIHADALAAVSAGGNHHGLTVPPGAFLSRQYGSRGGQEHLNTSVMDPMHPVTGSGGNHALVVPERKRPTVAYEGELPFDLADVRFRMLGPTEHLRAQRFWEGYDVSAANKSETTKGAGNAVAVNVAHWVGQEVMEVLA